MSRLRITGVRCTVMAVPRPGGGAHRNWVFVQVDTDAGLQGVGEATTEHHELAIKAHVESELRPRLLGMDPTEIERVWQLGFGAWMTDDLGIAVSSGGGAEWSTAAP